MKHYRSEATSKPLRFMRPLSHVRLPLLRQRAVRPVPGENRDTNQLQLRSVKEMATTSYGVNDPLAVKLWSKRLAVEVLKNVWAK